MRSMWVTTVLLFMSAGAAAEDRTSFFRSITIEPGLKPESVVCIGCSVVVKGDLDGEILTVGGDVTIYGRVRKDIVAAGGGVHIKNGAEVDSDVVSVGGMISTEGTVATPGARGFTSVPWMHLPGQLSIGWRGVLALLVFHSVCVLLPMLLLRPKRIQNVVVASRRWLLTGAIGLAAIIAFSYALDLVDDYFHSNDTAELVVTALFLAVFAAGIAGITFSIGDRFFPGRVAAAFSAGVLLLVALELIPYLGFLVMVLGSCWATGSALWSGLGFRGPQPPKLKKAPEVLKLA